MKRALLLMCACWSGPSTRTSEPQPGMPEARAKVVEQTASGGVLQLIGDRTTAMADATAIMEHQCGVRAYTIVQENGDRITYACTQ